MAFQEIILPEFVYSKRTVKISVFCDASLSIETPTRLVIASIGDLSERIDVVAGTYELQNVEITAYDNYDNEPEGFWKRVFSGAETPQLWITVDEGAGDTVYCIGSALLNTDSWRDYYLSADGAVYKRNVTFTVADVITVLQDVSVDDVATECLSHKIVDSLFASKPTISSLTPSGAGTETVGYRIAACTATDEDIWGNEVVTTNAPNGWGSVAIAWGAITGIHHYNIYRTTDSISNSIGLIGTLGVFSSPSFTDTGTGANPITQKAREYVCINDIFASFIAVAFGQTFDRANAIITENINNLRYSSDSVTSANCHSLYVSVESMTPGNILYWKNRYKTAWELFFALCKNFALIPRHFYDLSSSTHKIEFLTRENSYSTEISFSATTKESSHSSDTLTKINSVEAHRANGKNKYIVGYPIDAEQYDLSVSCEYVAGTIIGTPMTMGGTVLFGGYTIPKLYINSTTGFTEGKAYVESVSGEFEELEYGGIGVDAGKPYISMVTSKNSFYAGSNVYPADPQVSHGEMLFTFNGTSIETVTSMSYWNAQTKTLTSQDNGALHLASLRDYLRYRLTIKKQSYHKTYGNMSSTESGVTSQANTRICKRMTINNGLVSLSHYASEVVKSIQSNTADILWIAE